MPKAVAVFLSLLSIMFVLSCNKHGPKGERAIDETPRSVSPFTIDIAGIKLYQTRKELEGRVSSLRCVEKDVDLALCDWRTTDKDRKGVYRGIGQIGFTFYRDTLQTIRVRYEQMLDAEYANFSAAVRTKYAFAVGDRIIDTTGDEWQYDSLEITLVPNRRQHWTGSVFTYTPELEFQERSLYHRWVESLGERKVKPIY